MFEGATDGEAAISALIERAAQGEQDLTVKEEIQKGASLWLWQSTSYPIHIF